DYLGLLRLDGRGFVVLGAGPGIGGETCKALAQAGGRVLFVDQSLDAAKTAAAAVDGAGMAADVTKRADMERVFAKAQELFGDAFYGAVNVVGFSLKGKIDELDDQTFDRQYDLVLRHAWLTASIAGPMLARNGGGSIIFVGSLGGFAYHPNVALYCAAKGALNSLAKMSAVEFAPSGVRINVVAPGRIKSSGVSRPSEEDWRKIEASIPMKHAGEPKDVAAAILFLASDMSAYVTGEILMVDGGMVKVSPETRFA
ncbi:MAG: SDR family NAD(P)-dependent oxidoreductase, partial [Amphiplicatus sp.]